MVIQFSIPATGDCAPCCGCQPDGTLLDVTLTGDTLCGCTLNTDDSFYDLTATGVTQLAALLGLHEDIVLGTPTVIGTVEMQEFSDECVTPDGAPVDVDVRISVLCFEGVYSLEVQYENPKFPGSWVNAFQNLDVEFNTSEGNGLTCDGARAFLITTVEMTLAA